MNGTVRHAVPLLLLALAACALPAPKAPGTAASSPRALAAANRAAGALLQADAPGALVSLREVPAQEFDGAEAAFRTCVIERLDADGPVPPDTSLSDPFAREVLAAYRSYWWRALTRPSAREAEEVRLLHTLRDLLGPGARAETPETLEPLVADRLRDAGLHALMGRTPPLLELMIWSREEERRFEVALPEASHVTRVLVLDGFASLGWGEWATCGRHGAGGWAKPDALYAVRPRYGSLDDEVFRVSFLGHETQHLADMARHPGIAPWELEYRAKLTELSQAVETRGRLLARFSESQGDDPGVPHPYANRRVLAELRRRLGLAPGADPGETPIPALQRAAEAALREDTRRRLEATLRRPAPEPHAARAAPATSSAVAPAASTSRTAPSRRRSSGDGP